MARAPQDVPSSTELAVLQVLWDQGAATRRQITDVLYPGRGPAHYTTVQKLLERLERKGYVSADRSETVVSFRALVDREEFISRRLLEVADQLCGGSLTPLLINLVRSQPLSAREVEELRALVDDLSQQRKPRRKGQ
jgi:BlaI family penicillinase repressor